MDPRPDGAIPHPTSVVQGWRSVVAMSIGRAYRLLFIQDSLSVQRGDAGAQSCVLLASRMDVLTDSPIRTYGVRYVELCFGGQLMRLLYEALKGKAHKHSVDWSEERNRAFLDAKPALANATMLAHPSPDAPITITIDASDYAVGAVHKQWLSGAWQPLAFFSRQLRPSKRCHANAPLVQFPVPGRRFNHVNVDLVGPLPSSQGCTYLLTMGPLVGQKLSLCHLQHPPKWPGCSLGPGLPVLTLHPTSPLTVVHSSFRSSGLRSQRA